MSSSPVLAPLLCTLPPQGMFDSFIGTLQRTCELLQLNSRDYRLLLLQQGQQQPACLHQPSQHVQQHNPEAAGAAKGPSLPPATSFVPSHVYQTPLSPASDQWLEDMFKRMGGGAQVQAEEVSLQGWVESMPRRKGYAGAAWRGESGGVAGEHAAMMAWELNL